MDLEICGRGTVAGLLGAEPGRWDLLLISNPGAGMPEDVAGLARRLLHLEFDDFSWPREGGVLATRDDVRRALDWSADLDALVVCCHAGVSRSAAMAYVIACRDRSPTDALSVLTPDWHYPNELVVRFGADLLGNEEVYTACLAWLGGPEKAGRAWRRWREGAGA